MAAHLPSKMTHFWKFSYRTSTTNSREGLPVAPPSESWRWFYRRGNPTYSTTSPHRLTPACSSCASVRPRTCAVGGFRQVAATEPKAR